MSSPRSRPPDSLPQSARRMLNPRSRIPSSGLPNASFTPAMDDVRRENTHRCELPPAETRGLLDRPDAEREGKGGQPIVAEELRPRPVDPGPGQVTFEGRSRAAESLRHVILGTRARVRMDGVQQVLADDERVAEGPEVRLKIGYGTPRRRVIEREHEMPILAGDGDRRLQC